MNFLSKLIWQSKVRSLLNYQSSSEYFCNECENEWSREQAIEVAYSKEKLIKASVEEN